MLRLIFNEGRCAFYGLITGRLWPLKRAVRVIYSALLA